VEEELERIRLANLPTKEETEAEFESDLESVSEQVSASEITTREATVSDDVKITAKDILAMIIAAFSILLPYALIFIIMSILFIYFSLR